MKGMNVKPQHVSIWVCWQVEGSGSRDGDGDAEEFGALRVNSPVKFKLCGDGASKQEQCWRSVSELKIVQFCS